MKHFTKEQRYQIEAYIKTGQTPKFIANELGVHISSIYREIKRNAQKRGGYKGNHAEILAREKKERYLFKRTLTPELKKQINHYLEQEQWSPQQIVGFCRKNKIKMVSHESIYKYIREDKIKGGSLYKQLRHKLKHRKGPVGGFTSIKNKVSIEERPDVINNRERSGDWEIDTIIGKDGEGAIVTIVERTTGFLMMKKLPLGKHAEPLASVVIEMLLPYKKFVLSITSDNGTEFAKHEKIAKKLDIDFFFAHPYSSWERGLNEYTNKLIRQYIPKKSDFKEYSDKQITEIQHKINRRPREKLSFNSPKDIFYNLAA
jgi:IS30 family transposase